MLRNRRLRKAIVILLYWPFLAFVATRSVTYLLRHPLRVFRQEDEPDGDCESLAYRGMSGRFYGTVVTLFVKRSDLGSSLPAELTIVENDKLPDWLQQRHDHPVILLIGKQMNLGRRNCFLGYYRTVPLFYPYLETFVAIPFLRPSAVPGPSPCFHFVRIPCARFWPTELGILCMGYAKVQCPMQMSVRGGRQHYWIEEEGGGNPWLSVQTDLTDPVALDTSHDSLSKVISMLSQPLALIQGRDLLFFSFDLRFEAATLKAVSASGTIHPGFLPFVAERMDFSCAKITDAEFGAFFLETTFMNRRLG